MRTGGTLGIDVGGTGIKAGLVDTARGVLTTERFRIETPQPADPDAVMAVVADVAGQAGGTGHVGITFPGVVMGGLIRSAANLDPAWIGVNLPALVEQRLGRPAVALNDADAAGIAEVRHGVGKDLRGVVIMLTFGTGVGSAVFIDGTLLPNTELGHLELDGKDAETRVADSVREKKEWSWQKWATHANEYLAAIERLFSPDLLVIGGGIAKKSDQYLSLLTTSAPLAVAALGNLAGIVGAAMAAMAAESAESAA